MVCGQHEEEYSIRKSLLYCSKLDSCIHPPRVALKGNAFHVEGKDNIEMPKSCIHHDKFHADTDEEIY